MEILKGKVIRRGHLVVMHTEDGRTIVQLRGYGTKGEPYLELTDKDRRWLIGALIGSAKSDKPALPTQAALL